MLRRVPSAVGRLLNPIALSAPSRLWIRPASTNSKATTSENTVSDKDNLKSAAEEVPKKGKTQAELDEELRQKLEAMSGDGGAAGLELEDGQPVSMKRSVKNNMFRYI
ncbi:hypothetical protein IMSHALPRED_001446 [Imshaugia aleurites]|uniref:Uncharacterized protein n=1 Tax=Imshaugia aleurites TaxID=172621 RepID=A0A8H3ICW4_9LECA|nr:hypothetical protein IMSHALPRED_001446 [Imshaugia aleurites]